MKIYFARHGRTNYNDLNLWNADPTIDVHLTPDGIEQVKALAHKLKSAPIEHIFVSELKRTQQTAEIVNTFHNSPVEVSPLLNDMRSGYEGESTQQVLAALDKSDDRWTVRLKGGESIEDMKRRVAQFLAELKTRPYATVLVVTSQWPIQAAVALVKGIPNEDAWKLDVEPAGCIELEV
jgi:broad specificity phosphatase PhoE